MGLYLKYLSMHIKSAMEYRVSFMFLFITALLNPLGNLAVVWFMFWRFDNILGWRMDEVMLVFGLTYIGFSLAEVFGRGLDLFDRLIRLGTFDRMLVRPRSIVLQVLGSEFEITRIGRCAVGVWALVSALDSLDISWSTGKAAALAFAVVGSFCVFVAILFLRGAFCFITVEGMELTNILFDGGRETARYPISIYEKGFAFFFTFIVPFACANYYPALYIMGKAAAFPAALAPAVCAAFLAVCMLLFRAGMGRYASTG
ncbi:MAG: ABC-2 family transporter protein [Clostridiales bacterium]|jgi:ABC-2 type transport system permease protein|nr:ABC-2 family transporter protein [Clostridiales bacterium]